MTPITLATNTPGTAIPVSGSAAIGVAITPTLRRHTTTSVSCSPQSIVVGQPTTCAATVLDADTGTPSAPSGAVRFATNMPGNFVGQPCVLSGSGASAGCQVTYTPGAVGNGQHTLSVTYEGDLAHFTSGAQTTVSVALRTTGTTVSCAPASILTDGSTSCTATVTDTDAGTPANPTGKVTFTTAKLGGRFSASSCKLAGSGTSASCQVSYTPDLGRQRTRHDQRQLRRRSRPRGQHRPDRRSDHVALDERDGQLPADHA